MAYPKAYYPQEGYQYQILVMTPYDRSYEHCDYAEDKKEMERLIEEYRLAYKGGYRYKSILLPKKYWPSQSA